MTPGRQDPDTPRRTGPEEPKAPREIPRKIFEKGNDHMRTRTRWLATLALAAVAVAALGSSAALAGRDQPEPNPLEGEGSGLELIKNIPWKGGTDMEMTTI